MVAEALTILFLWTNPSLNQDGTPCTDLAQIRIRGKRETTGENQNFWHPLCTMDDGVPVCTSGPGLQDSMKVTLARRQGNDWWSFDAWAYDSTGNESYPSDAIRINVGTGAPITGVEPTPGVQVTDEWYNVRGQRIDRPVASGIYWRRRGATVERVVLVK